MIPSAIKIAPSILSADLTRLADAVTASERGGADLIHIDVMDGRFVPTISFGTAVVEAVRRCTGLPLDVHLMIVEPERHVDAFARAGADLITVHAEASPHLHRTLQAIRAHGVKASVALNPGTALGAIEWVLDEVDMVLLMTVNPGYSGQAFIPAVLPKVRELRGMLRSRGLDVPIQVDGGINPQTAPLAAGAGASVLVAASAVFQGEGGVEVSIARLRAAVAREVPHLTPP